MFPLALLNAASPPSPPSPPVLPTAICLFNEPNGATTASNTASNPLGTMPLYRQHKLMRVQHLFICTILVMVFWVTTPLIMVAIVQLQVEVFIFQSLLD